MCEGIVHNKHVRGGTTTASNRRVFVEELMNYRWARARDFLVSTDRAIGAQRSKDAISMSSDATCPLSPSCISKLCGLRAKDQVSVHSSATKTTRSDRHPRLSAGSHLPGADIEDVAPSSFDPQRVRYLTQTTLSPG